METDEVRSEGRQTLSVFDSLRKGFGFLLMSFGISSPAKKPSPTAKPAAKPADPEKLA
jgi:hypothetical protein